MQGTCAERPRWVNERRVEAPGLVCPFNEQRAMLFVGRFLFVASR